MAEKIVARIPAAPGTFAVVDVLDFDTGATLLGLERVIYWNIISDADGKPVSHDGKAGNESLAYGGHAGGEGYAGAYLHPDGTVEVPYESVYSSLKAYAAARNLEICQIFCDSDCNDVNVLLGKETKDDAFRLNFKVNFKRD